jgi:class 3 adenylate cyclase
MRPLYEGRTSVIRERIAPGPAGRAYEILDELAADGFTDYLATITQAENRLEMGLSVHLGRVAYGNIGGPRRLDFTVIGAAVNLASRLEGMCRTLGHPMVMSDPARCLTSPAAAC